MSWLRRMRGGSEDAALRDTRATQRDERLSAYLDGELRAGDAARLESDAAGDAELRTALEGMRHVRDGLALLATARAPRSFAIAPETARRRRLPRFELAMRLATVTASVALVSVLAAPAVFEGTGNGAQDVDVRAQPTMGEAAAAKAASQASDATQALTAPAAATPPANSGGGLEAAPAADQPSGAAELQQGAPAPEAETALAAAAEEPRDGGALAADDAAAAEEGDRFWIVQVAIAALTALLVTATGTVWLLRRTGGLYGLR